MQRLGCNNSAEPGHRVSPHPAIWGRSEIQFQRRWGDVTWADAVTSLLVRVAADLFFESWVTQISSFQKRNLCRFRSSFSHEDSNRPGFGSGGSVRLALCNECWLVKDFQNFHYRSRAASGFTPRNAFYSEYETTDKYRNIRRLNATLNALL